MTSTLTTSLSSQIDQFLNDEVERERTYVGASVLGEECDRALWYRVKQFPTEETPRQKRIFRLGHVIEEELVCLLSLAGIQVAQKGRSGEPFRFQKGIFAGTADGIIRHNGELYVLELKSAKGARFRQYQKKGVRSESKGYYIQLLTYMRFFGIPKGVFIIYNKDTSDLYFEEVTADDSLVDAYLDRGEEIYRMGTPPPQKWKDETFFKCRMCSFRKECWQL